MQVGDVIFLDNQEYTIRYTWIERRKFDAPETVIKAENNLGKIIILTSCS